MPKITAIPTGRMYPPTDLQHWIHVIDVDIEAPFGANRTGFSSSAAIVFEPKTPRLTQGFWKFIS